MSESVLAESLREAIEEWLYSWTEGKPLHEWLKYRFSQGWLDLNRRFKEGVEAYLTAWLGKRGIGFEEFKSILQEDYDRFIEEAVKTVVSHYDALVSDFFRSVQPEDVVRCWREGSGEFSCRFTEDFFADIESLVELAVSRAMIDLTPRLNAMIRDYYYDIHYYTSRRE